MYQGLIDNKLFLAIAKALESEFNAGDWIELGYETQTKDWINSHPRLIRSLNWGDEDYKGHIFRALEIILSKSQDNLSKILQSEKISQWLKGNEPKLFEEYVSSEIIVAPFKPAKPSKSGVVERAIVDAETLIYSSGATSGVDRIHTALHGYLLEVCDQKGVSYGSDPSITFLFKILRQNHPKLQCLGNRSEDIEKVLRSMALLIDTLNPLRNKASIAHPNRDLLQQEEAMLVINATKTVLHYLDSKLTK